MLRRPCWTECLKFTRINYSSKTVWHLPGSEGISQAIWNCSIRPWNLRSSGRRCNCDRAVGKPRLWRQMLQRWWSGVTELECLGRKTARSAHRVGKGRGTAHSVAPPCMSRSSARWFAEKSNGCICDARTRDFLQLVASWCRDKSTREVKSGSVWGVTGKLGLRGLVFKGVRAHHDVETARGE